MNKRALGYWLAFASAAAGAVRYNVAVYGNQEHGVEYESLLALAMLVGVVLSGIHVAVRDGGAGFLPLRGRWKHALLYGALMSWSSLSHFVALHTINETVMVSLTQTTILFTILLAVWLLGERFTRGEWLATIVICSGILLFQPWESGRAVGFAIVLSGAVSAAFATVVAKRRVKDIPPRVLMFWRNAVALVVVGVYAFVRFDLPPLTWEVILIGVAIGALGPYLHALFFLQALQYVDAAKAALVNRVQPALVFGISWLFLSRMVEVSDLVSMGLLIVGAVWLSTARPKAK